MTTTTRTTTVPTKKRQNQEILIRPLDTFAGHAVRGFQRSVRDAPTPQLTPSERHRTSSRTTSNAHPGLTRASACHRVRATARADARTPRSTTSSTRARAQRTPKESPLALSQLRAYARRRPEVGLGRGEEGEGKDDAITTMTTTTTIAATTTTNDDRRGRRRRRRR